MYRITGIETIAVITKAIDIWQKNKVNEFISVITKAINDYKEE